MPPDSSRVSRRSMHQRNSFSGGDLRTRFASHQTGPQTLPHNNGHDSRERRTSSRKTRDLVVAVSAICLVSYFLSFFQPASFDGSELFLYQHSPVVVPSSRQDAPSDDVIQVVNTRWANAVLALMGCTVLAVLTRNSRYPQIPTKSTTLQDSWSSSLGTFQSILSTKYDTAK